MDSIKQLARKAKKRMKSDFWEQCKNDMESSARQAKDMGLNERAVKNYIGGVVQSKIKGEVQDEFYLKVKNLLDSEGEVSDAIGRLTDKEYYEALSYAEKQRYSLELSEKYLRALEKYRKEKEFSV